MQTNSVRASATRGLGTLLLMAVLSASVSTGSDALAAEPADTGVFDALSDIGPVKFAGTVRHDSQSQTYRLKIIGAEWNVDSASEIARMSAALVAGF